MKYIRTKEGKLLKLYKKQERPNGEYDTWYKGNEISLLYNHDHSLIEREADTIEELCDEFVCEQDHKLMKPYWKKYNEQGYCEETYQQGILNAFRDKRFNSKDYTWLGAIWTDKGLVYVAKMNEKGELELL